MIHSGHCEEIGKHSGGYSATMAFLLGLAGIWKVPRRCQQSIARYSDKIGTIRHDRCTGKRSQSDLRPGQQYEDTRAYL